MRKTIKLSKEQNACVKYNAGDLLIKGVPGSGKSYVILKRALKLYEESEGTASIRIFTYTSTLVKYTEEILTAKIKKGGIDVSTVDSYFLNVYRSMSRHRFYTNDKKCLEVIEKTLTDHSKRYKNPHRFYSLGNDFWKEEFLWIQERCITSEEEYIQVSRHGRGSQIKITTKEDKRRAWKLYELFCKNMKANNLNTWPEIYLYINENVDRIPEKFKVDYVFVDEAQDMTLGKMRALKAISRKSITIAADMAQKIYKTSFTWREAGIDIQGRASKSLTRTFRSTKQIVELAEDLAQKTRKNDSFKGELTDAVFPESEGPLPSLYVFNKKLDEEAFLAELVTELLKQRSDKTVGVVCKTRKYYYHIRKLLSEKEIPYQEVFRDGNYKPDWKLLQPGLKLVVTYSSKGLEFDTVIIPDMNEGTYPFVPWKIDDEQLDDYLAIERNLLYVAMTRAREVLFMLCTERKMSRFIEEFSQEHYKCIRR